MTSTPARAALIAALLLLGAACGTGTKSDEDVRADLSTALQRHEGFDKESADCFAGVLMDELGADELRDVSFSDDSPSAALGEDFVAAAATADERCDLEGASG